MESENLIIHPPVSAYKDEKVLTDIVRKGPEQLLEKKCAVAADIMPVRSDRIVQHGTAHVIKIIVFAVPEPPAGCHVAVRVKVIPVVFPE